MQYSNAAMMYGLIDGEKTNVPFEIAENGDLGFNMGGEYVSYNDFEQPFPKDYKVASSILSQSADLYKNHTLLQGPQKDMLRLSLMASLRDPNTIKSLVSDFESDGLNLSDIPLDDIEVARNMIADRIMNSYTDVAAQGKADYDARNPSRSGGGRSGGSGSGGKDYTERWADVDKYPQTPQNIKGRKVQKFDPNNMPSDLDPATAALYEGFEGDGYFVDGVLYTREEAEDILNN
jgi:hypothetical protein